MLSIHLNNVIHSLNVRVYLFIPVELLSHFLLFVSSYNHLNGHACTGLKTIEHLGMLRAFNIAIKSACFVNGTFFFHDDSSSCLWLLLRLCCGDAVCTAYFVSQPPAAAVAMVSLECVLYFTYKENKSGNSRRPYLAIVYMCPLFLPGCRFLELMFDVNI